MGYSPAAADRRRCQATRSDGRPCRAWAMWDDLERRCSIHAGRAHAGDGRYRYRVRHAAYPPCDCPAYAWPHRPGGGLCCWPDEPEWRCTVPAGSHSWPRLHAERLRGLR